jgi:hypothetical protein
VNDQITQFEKATYGELINFKALSPKPLLLTELVLLNDPLYGLHGDLQIMGYLAAQDSILYNCKAFSSGLMGWAKQFILNCIRFGWSISKIKIS